MSLAKPRLVALDTAQLSGWARDRASSELERRRRAQRFDEGIAERGWIVTLSLHHLHELLGTESNSAAEAAINLLADLPMVAWIGKASGGAGPGSIVDRLGVEVAAHLAEPNLSAENIRDAVLKGALNIASGREAIGVYFDHWRDLQPEIWRQASEQREIFAITASTMNDLSNVKIVDAVNMRARKGDELDRSLDRQQIAFQREISLLGDRRIVDPQAVSEAFSARVRAARPPVDGSDMIRWMSDYYEVDVEELGPGATVADITQLGLFRQQVKLACESVGINPSNARLCKPGHLPSWLINEGLRRNRQAGLRRDGSEMNDWYLAGMSAYADLTFVDKRIKDNLDRAVKRKDLTRGLMRRVEKNRANYFNLLEVNGLM